MAGAIGHMTIAALAARWSKERGDTLERVRDEVLFAFWRRAFVHDDGSSATVFLTDDDPEHQYLDIIDDEPVQASSHPAHGAPFSVGEAFEAIAITANLEFIHTGAAARHVRAVLDGGAEEVNRDLSRRLQTIRFQRYDAPGAYLVRSIGIDLDVFGAWAEQVTGSRPEFLPALAALKPAHGNRPKRSAEIERELREWMRGFREDWACEHGGRVPNQLETREAGRAHFGSRVTVRSIELIRKEFPQGPGGRPRKGQ